MKKQEFLERMERCKIHIKIGLCKGICNTLTREFYSSFYDNGEGYFTFTRLFSPGYNYPDYWLSIYTNNEYDARASIEQRLLFLDMFEGYCLVYKLYKEF